MILDTNILLMLVHHPESPIVEWVENAQARASLHINPIIFAEMSPNFAKLDDLECYIAGLAISIEGFTNIECYRAGQAFIEYRRRGGQRESILPDFMIGAQAEIRGWPLVTRDLKGFASYFPDLVVIDPFEGSI